MKKFSLTLFLITGSISLLFAWGVWGHQHINHAAVFALPKEMQPFFYNHIDFITEESVVPDLRKYTINDKAEFPRHYINLEAFAPITLEQLPRTMKEATAKFDQETLNKNGLLPWYIQDMMDKLTLAMKEKRKTEILFLAADLGHYLADANMPLHTSLNHDGELTNQKGIHGFWESQLPELLGDQYRLNAPQAVYIPNITDETWRIVKHSHQLADTLLSVEKSLHQKFPKDKIYKTDATGQILKNKFRQPVHSVEYAKAYNDALNGMVENQIRNAITDVANYWFTAWVNAGKPDLTSLDDAALTQSNQKRFKKEIKAMKKGKIWSLKTDNEY
jgi:hypothetical protein